MEKEGFMERKAKRKSRTHTHTWTRSRKDPENILCIPHESYFSTPALKDLVSQIFQNYLFWSKKDSSTGCK